MHYRWHRICRTVWLALQICIFESYLEFVSWISVLEAHSRRLPLWGDRKFQIVSPPSIAQIHQQWSIADDYANRFNFQVLPSWKAKICEHRIWPLVEQKASFWIISAEPTEEALLSDGSSPTLKFFTIKIEQQKLDSRFARRSFRGDFIKLLQSSLEISRNISNLDQRDEKSKIEKSMNMIQSGLSIFMSSDAAYRDRRRESDTNSRLSAPAAIIRIVTKWQRLSST